MLPGPQTVTFQGFRYADAAVPCALALLSRRRYTPGQKPTSEIAFAGYLVELADYAVLQRLALRP